MIKIFFAEDSERAEDESIARGCRLDVLVEIEGKYYKPVVNTIDRLKQEVKDTFERHEIFDVEPCQIIVENANKDTVIKTILYLNHNRFFDYFTPINLKKLYQNSFVELTDIRNWTQVY